MPIIWTVFVGDNGDQIAIYNSRYGPFPPEPETKGYIAIGWPKIGDLTMYKDKYQTYLDMFRKVYYKEGMREQVFVTKANMPWYFAFKMAIGDWVICPASAFNLLLIGEVISEYKSDYGDELGIYGRRRPDFVHYREVQWKSVITSTDARYRKLNQIGQLTVSRPDISFADLQDILNS